MCIDAQQSELPTLTNAVIGRAPGSLLPTATGGRSLSLGLCVVVLIAIGNAAHDLAHGYPLWLSVLTGAMIVGQCAAMTLGHSLALHWNAPRWSMVAGGVLVSAASGLIILVPHSQGWHFSGVKIGAASVVVGLSVAGLWVLLFLLPILARRRALEVESLRREAELSRMRALEVESLRREAELTRLRVHLHPHFLLNTLNAIAGLVTEDASEARRLIAALGDLVRDALSDGEELRPFAAEVAWLRRYAEILEARHLGFLSFRWELAEETLAALIPRLLLQPLVENAVKHGALRRREGGSVLIRSETLTGEAVRFVIEDDGPGIGADPSEGLGISLVRRRLALVCPGGSMRFAPIVAGTSVVVELPKLQGGSA